jgi:hypothetical protein
MKKRTHKIIAAARRQEKIDRKYVRKVKRSAFYRRILELQKENKHLHGQLARQIKLRQESLATLNAIRQKIQEHYPL